MKKNHYLIIIICIIVAIISIFLYFRFTDKPVHAALTSFEISTLPQALAEGSLQTITITALEGANVLKSYDGTIHFSSDDPTAILPANYTFNPAQDQGVKIFANTLSFNQVGEFKLKVEDISSAVSSEQDSIEVFYGHTNGSVITSSSTSKVYCLDGNNKRWIKNPSIFNSQFRWNEILRINNTELEKYADGADWLYPDGTLITNSGKVYVISEQAKLWIVSPSVFNALGYKWENIIWVGDDIADAYNNGNDFSDIDSHPNSTIIAAAGDPKVYILENNEKRWIQNADIFSQNYNWNYIVWISADEKNNYPNGTSIGRRDGTLIHYGGKVYALEYTKKRHILSPEAFSNLGYAWNNIQNINSSELTLYSNGEDIVAERFADYSAVIYGDSRSGHTMHQQLVNEIIQTDPEIMFHTGDLVSTGDNTSDWNYFNNITEPLRSKIAFYPAIGNHELPTDTYLSNFELPNNEKWYSVDKDGIHYIVLDSNSDISLDSEQYAWLENDLNNISEDNNFTVVIFHHPSYNTGSHAEDEKNFQTDVIPLFKSKGVDIVFNGHDHNYERSLVNGIYYIVTGGGGAPLYDQTRSSEYSQKFLKKYHFCRMKITADHLIVEVYDDTLNQIDQFVITKNPPVAFYADSQSDTDAEDQNHQKAVNYILNTAADSVFHAGDLQENGTADSLNRFNTVTNTLRSTRNFYAAMGNNESNSSLYFDNFVFPGNERWYSINTGNLHMVVLDNTYSSLAIGSEQYSWLESDLQSEASQSRITGIIFHYPVYNSSGDPKGMINTVVSLFRNYGVDFVIAGHIHQYRKDYVDGIYYFTNTGQTALGYMIANVLEDEVWLNIYDSNNSLIDTVTFDAR